MSNRTTRVVVLGAGYSGLLAAKLAARRTDARVTLINAGERFVERIRLHQHAAGQRLRDLPLRRLLDGTDITFVKDRVVGIDADDQSVALETGGDSVPYDVLIYALGSRADLRTTPGVDTYAETVADVAHADRLRRRLRESRSVVVVGGGLTGIETAAELADSHPGLPVRLVTGGAFASAFSTRGGQHVRRAFGRLGVRVTDEVRVAEVDGDGLILAGGERVAADTVVWTTGFEVPVLAADAGFAVDETGRILVDGTLRSVSHPQVYAVGDAAAARRVDGQPLRMACATGLPVAQHATRALADRLAGREPGPLRFRYLNQCVSLGRRDGLIQFVRADDSPVETVLTGRAAAFYKEAIVRSAVLTQRHPALAAVT
ncbi:NAD(P)/FAD-dependent oxidoreductase [Streptomyces sp. NBC_01506]|uniref:NAD(P)/FAD-dependent oxidoreductase n=1 Tax=Streptomyces sp. NBC_01506 TaxID=2903887 RepID=UPI00386BFBBA